MMTDTGVGQMQPTDQASDFNAISFMIQQALARTRTVVLVKIIAVHNQGGVEPVGFVDVQPLVSMIDGANVATPHGTIFNIPYMRLQGGRNAIIIDPVVDDIGLMAIADRDISSVKENRKASAPGSFRRFDLADGVYLGGILNAAPEQYVRFTDDEIEVVATTKIKITAPTVEVHASTLFDVTGPTRITGNTEIVGNLVVTGSISAASAAISGALTAASAAISGAFSAASAAISGALTAASAAITNLLSAGSVSSDTSVTATTEVTANGIGLTTHHHVINVPSTPSGNLNTSGPFD